MEKVKCPIRVLEPFGLKRIEKNNECLIFECHDRPGLNAPTDADEPKLHQLQKKDDRYQIHD